MTMELLVTAAAIPFLILAWKAWRLSALDAARDQLFDLRDSAREFFHQSGRGLAHPQYAAIRDLLNAYIRYMEANRFAGLLYLSATTPVELVRALSDEINARFATDDDELRRFLAHTRHRAVRITQTYMFVTSSLAVVTIAAALPIMALQSLNGQVRLFLMRVKTAYAALVDQFRPVAPATIEVAAFADLNRYAAAV